MGIFIYRGESFKRLEFSREVLFAIGVKSFNSEEVSAVL